MPGLQKELKASPSILAKLKKKMRVREKAKRIAEPCSGICKALGSISSTNEEINQRKRDRQKERANNVFSLTF